MLLSIMINVPSPKTQSEINNVSGFTLKKINPVYVYSFDICFACHARNAWDTLQKY